MILKITKSSGITRLNRLHFYVYSLLGDDSADEGMDFSNVSNLLSPKGDIFDEYSIRFSHSEVI